MDIKLKINSDLIGASASTLCTIHCLATPLVFVASACTQSCCTTAPTWWIAIDYFFLIISFVAVYRSAKTTSAIWIKPVIWLYWTALFVLIIVEHNLSIQISPYYKYIAAISLAITHIYNMKYCQCNNDECCVEN